MKNQLVFCSLLLSNFLTATIFELRTAADAKVVDVLYAAVTNDGDSPALQCIDIKSSYGVPPLCLAVLTHAVKATEFLLEHGARVDAIAGRKYSALMIAANLGNYDIVALLLSYGANPYIRSIEGKTACAIAAEEGYREIAELIGRYEQYYFPGFETSCEEQMRDSRKRVCREWDSGQERHTRISNFRSENFPCSAL